MGPTRKRAKQKAVSAAESTERINAACDSICSTIESLSKALAQYLTMTAETDPDVVTLYRNQINEMLDQLEEMGRRITAEVARRSPKREAAAFRRRQARARGGM